MERSIMRDSFLLLLSNFEEFKQLSADEQIKIRRDIEKSCFVKAIQISKDYGVYRVWDNPQFRAIYSSECSRIICVIQEIGVIAKIINKDINLLSIAYITSEELCPHKFKDIRNTITTRELQHIEEKVSRAYTCRKCGNDKTTLLQYQSRAGDEEGSLSVKCITCGHIWSK